MSGRSGFGSPELTYGFITHSLSVPMNECLSVVYVTASAHLAYTEEYQLHHLESTSVNACMLNLCCLEGRWEEGKNHVWSVKV